MAGNHGPTDTWIRCFHPLPGARIRVVCFPHAGGSASYYHPVSRALSDFFFMTAPDKPLALLAERIAAQT